MTRMKSPRLPTFSPRGRMLMVVGIAAVVGLVSAAALSGIAFGTGNASFATLSSSPSTRWTWNTGVVPGTPVATSSMVEADASRAAVATSSLREAATAGDGLTLLFGRNSSGALCTAASSPQVLGQFNCLSAWSDNFAILLYSHYGGPPGGLADYGALVGIARPDVARVSITTSDGTVDVPLNQWRAFSYTASTTKGVPLSVTAYDAAGTALDTHDVAGNSLAEPEPSQ